MKRLSRCTMALAISLLLVLPKKMAHGCVFSVRPEYYRVWLLQPDIANQKDLNPFFLASTYIHPDYDRDAIPTFHYDQNVREWRELMDNKATAPDIDTLLYHTSPEEVLQHFSRLAKRNSFARELLLPKRKEFFQYLKLSKKIEALTTKPDPWQEQRYADPAFDRLIEESSSLYDYTKHPVIRLRIAYQLMRLCSYAGEIKMLNKIWREKVQNVKTNSWVKAAAAYEQAIKVFGYEGDYMISRVFDQWSFNRANCLMRLRYTKLPEVLRFAKNDHERTVLYVMRMFNDPGRTLHNLKFIYSREPNYKELNFLLLREINKTEDWLLTNKVTDFEPATYPWEAAWTENARLNYYHDRGYAMELLEFVKQMVSERKNKDRALLHICAAHLSFMLGDQTGSRRYLEVAARLPHLPANIKTQILISDLLLNLETEKAFTEAIENKLMHLVLMPDKQTGLHNASMMKDQLLLYTGRKLIERGEKAKGFLMLAKTGKAFGELPRGIKSIYEEMWEKASPADYDVVLNVLDKRTKTPFEAFVSTGYLKSAWPYYEAGQPEEDSVKWDRNRLLNLKGGWYIQQDSLEKAAATLSLIPGSFWKKYPFSDYIKGDPFYLSMYHSHSAESWEEQYNKQQIVAGMVQLKKKVETDPDNAALYYYKLANAYYNMSYYGKHWLVSMPWWSVDEERNSKGDSRLAAFYDNYYGCVRARQYYLKALQATKDKKLASLCCVMAGKCQENYRDYSACLRNKKNKRGDNPYIGLLKDKNMNTAYYKELIEECATYASFIKQLNKRY